MPSIIPCLSWPSDYRDRGMVAYSKLQEEEFATPFSDGYTAVKHQREVGTGYFDSVGIKSSMQVIAQHWHSKTAQSRQQF